MSYFDLPTGHVEALVNGKWVGLMEINGETEDSLREFFKKQKSWDYSNGTKIEFEGMKMRYTYNGTTIEFTV